MNSEFDKMMRDIENNLNNFNIKMDESKDISDKIKPVLDAMSKGIEGDYKMKESLIKKEYLELE